MNDVVITGLVNKPQSYSELAGRKMMDEDTTEEEELKFLQNKNIDSERENTEACHTIN